MLKNYIKFGFRFLTRNKVFTFINLSGLTLGLVSCLFILNYVQQELAYDSFHEHAEHIYRVNLHASGESGTRQLSAISPPMGPALEAELPEVAEAVRLRHADDVLIRIGDNHFYEDRIFYADPSFFDVFSFPLKAGDRRQVLAGKYSAVISSELAEKYFAGEDPVGKNITVNDDITVTVTGVAGEPAAKSHLRFEMLISFQSFEVPHGYPVTLESWGWTSFPTYVRLHEGTDPASLQEKLHNFIISHMGEETASRVSLHLQPVVDIHLKSREIAERDGTAPKGDMAYTYGLLVIAMLILLIAVFNFANLSTAVSLKRVREIGVRKALGAARRSLFLQHLTESFLLSTGSFLLAVALVEVFSAPLSAWLQADLTLASGVHWQNLPWYILLISVLGLSGGLYPSLYLSNYSPIKALKGKLTLKASRMSMKNVLMVFQFFITIGLIAGSLVIGRQMNYLAEREPGFDQEQVVAIQMVGEELHSRYAGIRQALKKNAYVKEVTAAGDLFDGQNGSVPVQEAGNDESLTRISLFGAHYDFGKVMNLQFVAGRDFSETFANDSSNFILNEAAVKMFGWTDDPIGKQLLLNGMWQGEVIGVVKDFHFASMHEEIMPLVLYIPRAYQDYVLIKTTSASPGEVIASLEHSWKQVNPDMPFDFRFIDDHIGQLYKSDQQFTAMINSFSVLAVLLACMGLYGMVSFHVEARRKEMGIRKVIGATVGQVAALLSQRFVFLVLLAAVPAVSLSWFLLERWLTDFAYAINLEVWWFAAALLTTLVFAGATVGAHTIRAALNNPVDVLKEE